MSLARKLIESCDKITADSSLGKKKISEDMSEDEYREEEYYAKHGYPSKDLEFCKYAEGGSYDPGDNDTPPSMDDYPTCSIGNFECPFEIGEEVHCPLYQLKEGYSEDIAETFCFDSEIKNGKLFCTVNNQPCQKVNDIKTLVEDCGGDLTKLYMDECPIQIHDAAFNVRPGKSEE